MNYLKEYARNVGDFVLSVIDDPPNNADKECEESKSSEIKSDESTQETGNLSTQESSAGFFDWIPKLKTSSGENPVVHCINTLASLGSETAKPDALEVLETKPTPDVTPVAECPPAETRSSDNPGTEQNEEGESVFSHWLTDLSSRSEEVWKQMRHDLTEVMSAISTEPKDALTRTASSLRQHLSTAASAMGKIDPNRFTLLPEPATSSAVREDEQSEGNTADLAAAAAPPPSSDLPSLKTLRSDMSQLMSGLMSGLFGTGEEPHERTGRNKREARLQVLRADPATYELEPPLPPAHLGVHSYADWRAAYFDETTCQPRPGIPIGETRDASSKDLGTDNDLLEPPHPSPEELLEQYPFMRTYLSQLVHSDDQPDKKPGMMTAADFWSRYYFRVWLSDVIEHRRQRLAKRVESIAKTGDESRDAKPESLLSDDVSRDWLDLDSETASPPTEVVQQQDDTQTVVAETSFVALEASGSTKKPTSDHKSARSKKRRNKADRHSKDGATTKSAPPVQQDDAVIKHVVANVDSQGDETNGGGATGESDDAVTSSSSLVIVTTGEEDAEDVAGKEPYEEPTRLTASSAQRPTNDASDHDMDVWGEVDEEDLQDLTISQSFVPISSTGEAKNEATDWDDWS